MTEENGRECRRIADRIMDGCEKFLNSSSVTTRELENFIDRLDADAVAVATAFTSLAGNLDGSTSGHSRALDIATRWLSNDDAPASLGALKSRFLAVYGAGQAVTIEYDKNVKGARVHPSYTPGAGHTPQAVPEATLTNLRAAITNLKTALEGFTA